MGAAEARVLMDSEDSTGAAGGAREKKAGAVGVDMAEGGREDDEPVALSCRLDRSVVRKARTNF